MIGTAVFMPATSRAAVGSWTPADVNAAVAKGVAYLDSTQNADGSFGSSFPPAETAFAIISYGVLDKGDFHNLSPAIQTHLQSAVTYLLSQQSPDGSFGCFYCTYTTGLALDALSASSGVAPGIPAAISSGRTYLISIQNAPPAVTGNPLSPDCSSADQPPAGSGSDTYCGGWNYDAGFGRSDESNTGFALTGLFLTGGVPAATASINVGWQRHVQELQATNYFAARNDGGGDYEPGISFGGFSSNANDTGSLLFGYGYDAIAGSDPKVQAALTFGTDILDEYELVKTTVRSMIYHFGMNEDGTCDFTVDPTCDWAVAGDGGYHYSLWALTKGFGQYIAPDLSNPANWYAKVVDLLLTEQSSDGSWPVDLRDDFTSIVATSFAVDALGLVGVPTHTLTVTKSGSGSGTVTSSPTGIDCGATCSAPFSQGTMVTLTATPAADSTFTGWSGDCTGPGPCTVTMDQDRAVTATFDLTSPPTAHTTLTKTASPTSGVAPLTVTYTYHEANEGTEPLTGVALTDDTCSPVVRGPDSPGNNDATLDPGETWTFTCTHTFTTGGTFTNTATATGNTSTGAPAPPETATATVTVTTVHTTLTKTASPTSGVAPLTVTYTYHETNDGTEPLSSVALTDDTCSPVLRGPDSPGNNDATLDPGETWTFTCTHIFTTAGTFTNTVAATGMTSTGAPAPEERATATITVTPPLVQALTPGFWKNHEAATTALLPQTLGTFTVGDFATATAVFAAMNCSNSSKSTQNAVGCLAGHLLAAKLNVANGASTCIAPTITAADAFLVSVGYIGPTGTYTLTPDQRATAISLKSTLDAYNNTGVCT
jgi:hypothetical protein